MKQLFVIAHAQKILAKQTIQNSGYTQTLAVDMHGHKDY